MSFDALFPNLPTGRLLGRADAVSPAPRDADGADASQFASLLSDLDERNAPAARMAKADSNGAATEGADDRSDRRPASEAVATDTPSNAPLQMRAFAAVPPFDIDWSPSSSRSAPARSDAESSTDEVAPTRVDASESTLMASGAESGASTAFTSVGAIAPNRIADTADRRTGNDAPVRTASATTNVATARGGDALSAGDDRADLITRTDLRGASAEAATPTHRSAATLERKSFMATASVDVAVGPNVKMAIGPTPHSYERSVRATEDPYAIDVGAADREAIASASSRHLQSGAALQPFDDASAPARTTDSLTPRAPNGAIAAARDVDASSDRASISSQDSRVASTMTPLEPARRQDFPALSFESAPLPSQAAKDDSASAASVRDSRRIATSQNNRPSVETPLDTAQADPAAQPPPAAAFWSSEPMVAASATAALRSAQTATDGEAMTSPATRQTRFEDLASQSEAASPRFYAAASPFAVPTGDDRAFSTPIDSVGVADRAVLASLGSVAVNRRSTQIGISPSLRATSASVIGDRSSQIARSASAVTEIEIDELGLSEAPLSDPPARPEWRSSAQVDDGRALGSAASRLMQTPSIRSALESRPASSVEIPGGSLATDPSVGAMSVAPSNDRVATSSSTDRASGNDSRSKSSDAAQPVSPSLAGIAPPIGAPGADPSSDRGRQSERRFFAETSDRRGSNVDVRSAAHDVGNYVQAPTSASPAQLDTSNVSAPEPIGTLAIFAPSTQLPTAFAELLVPQARSLLASASPASAPATAAASAAPIVEAQRHVGAPKILTIELEPASLGAVTVKMKLAHSGIDMRISVESTEALHRLDATRDRLVEAMQSSGCTVDSCTIQIGQNVAGGGAAQAASDSGAAFAQSSGTGAGRDEQSVDRQGVGHGGQGGDRRQSASGEANDSTPNGEPRRVAARRGDDVYL